MFYKKKQNFAPQQAKNGKKFKKHQIDQYFP